MSLVLATSRLHPRVTEYLQVRTRFRIAKDATADTLLVEGRDASVIIVRDPIPEELFDAAPNLRAVIRHGAGLDMIPVEAATRAGVLVFNLPGLNAQGVAEYVLMSTLALRRGLLPIDRALHRDGWHEARRRGVSGRDAARTTLGLIGTGAIGRAVHRLVSTSLQMTVLGYNRSGVTPEGIDYRELDEVLAESDVVVLACPLTPETRGLLNLARLRTMKPGAALVNVSRGPVVDEAALLQVLDEGLLSGAALDVFSTQPLPSDHPFTTRDNVILTPHIAGATDESMKTMGFGAADAALQVLKNEVPPNLVNPEALASARRT